jgi:hypothetical protein
MFVRAVGYVVAGRNCEGAPETRDLDPPAKAAYRWVLAWFANRVAAASNLEPSPSLQVRNSNWSTSGI